MRYKIDSVWTKSHEDEINKLNSIIDNHNWIEHEINKKLNIMKQFNTAFDEAIEDFNFCIVINFMKSHNWKWYFYENGKEWYAVPTKQDMIVMMRREMLNRGLYNIIEGQQTSYSVSGGGIIFEMKLIDNKCYVDIAFDIAHFVDDNV